MSDPIDEFLAGLERLEVSRCLVWRDPPSGLVAPLVIDSTALGPAAGGMRTRRHASAGEALAEVSGLTRAMTAKCALAGVAAGGARA